MHIPSDVYMQSLQSTFCTVDEELLRRCLEDIYAGRETTQQMLIEHDATFGRTTRKNKEWALTLEKDLREMSETIVQLRKALKFETAPTA